MSTEQDPPLARVALRLALALAVLLRIVWPLTHMAPMIDEGGWPLSVRQWATDGIVTYDFHTAPGYHLVLGTVFRLTAPTLDSARWASVVLSLCSLALFWLCAQRLLEDRRAAGWATLLWAACFPATDIAQRALIEPLQLVWLLGLILGLTMTGKRTFVAVALAAAGLLLTKANAMVLLPVLLAALWLPGPAALGERRLAKVGGLAAGFAIAAVAFFALYLYDSETFLLGWGPTMAKAMLDSPMPIVRVGRFVLDPTVIENGTEFLSAQTPFLFALGLLGTIRALLLRRALLAGLWVALLFPFLLVQVIPSPHYFFLLYPALSLVAADLLLGAAREGSGPWRWPTLAVLVIALDGMGRTAALMATAHSADRAAVTYLREHADASDHVLAAPYILMQLGQRGTSIFAIPAAAMAPDSVVQRAEPPEWIVVDPTEWRDRMRAGGHMVVGDPAVWFANCCDRVFADDPYKIYRVRPRTETP